jgi:hypothetical protein
MLSACALLYCHLWSVRLYNIFYYLTNDTIFGGGGGLPNKKLVLIFSTTFVQNISHSVMNSATYCRKYKNIFMWCIRYSCQILIKVGQIYKKYWNIKFGENPSVRSELFHKARRTDGRIDMTKLIVAFCNFVNEPKNRIYTNLSKHLKSETHLRHYRHFL